MPFHNLWSKKVHEAANKIKNKKEIHIKILENLPL